VPVFRAIVLALLVACALCFALHAFTGNPKWKAWGRRLLYWTGGTLLVFFAVVGLQQLTR
jgi:peptidoglycan/LPS O-acetylase OafA/YrhL